MNSYFTLDTLQVYSGMWRGQAVAVKLVPVLDMGPAPGSAAGSVTGAGAGSRLPSIAGNSGGGVNVAAASILREVQVTTRRTR